MSIPANINPNTTMSKLETTAIIANLINVAICIHVGLSGWVDHNPVPFFYFYIICIGLIINSAYVFLSPNSSK